MELWLVAQTAEGVSRSVIVDAAADATIDALSDALAEHLGVSAHPGGLAIRVARTGRWLSGGARLADAALRHGDRVVVAPPRTAGPDDGGQPSEHDATYLQVVGGPSAGQRILLSPGRHVVGRDPDRSDISFGDGSLSGAHLALSVDGDRIEVTDEHSKNGTLLEGEQLAPGVPRSLEPGQILQAGRSLMIVERLQPHVDSLLTARDGSVAFNRPPRVALAPLLTPVHLEAPPGDPSRIRLPLVTSLIPLVGGVVLAVVLRQPAMLLFAVLSPLMAVTSVLLERRSTSRDASQRVSAYRKRLLELRTTLRVARADEVRERRGRGPDAVELSRRANRNESDLWERRPDDPDFLHLRVGAGDLPTVAPLVVELGGAEVLRNEAEDVAGEFDTVASVPVLVPLPEVGALGLAGAPDRVSALARWLVLQAAVLHSPRDLVIAAALSVDRVADWQWLAWLPHTHADTSPVGVTHVVADADGSSALVEAFARLIEHRLDDSRRSVGGRRPGPFALLVLDERAQLDRATVTRIMDGAASAGVGVIWLGSDPRRLPGECAVVVELDDAVSRLTLTDARTGVVTRDVTADGISPQLALDAALALAPLRDQGASGAHGQLPAAISLVELMGLPRLDANAIDRRWDAHDGDLGAVIGIGGGGPVWIDLRRDGPHALIAGTTGSGKSELLQTIVASLAATHPPDRLTFLLVDYKGGAAFRECSSLPHTVGLVTDLDGHLAERVLVSLNAELRRREGILREAGAKDLIALELANPALAPPSLVVVIDEFATLASEIPEFVDGVVNIAQRGRSLGIHLILATQRPAGVVSASIRANTNLRVSLRVGDAHESDDVIASPEAARIPRQLPGRGYLRTGHSELIEFQAGFVGGDSDARAVREPVVVRDLGLSATMAVADPMSGAGTRHTDLERLTKLVEKAATKLRIASPAPPWLPPLPDLVALLPRAPASGAALPSRVVLGLADEPAAQRQRAFEIDLAAAGSVLVYGTSGSGKTTFLRTLAVDLAAQADPRQVHIYAMDFATRGLKPLEQLPHCGAVIVGEDLERTQRLLLMLRRELAHRKELLARVGVYTLEELHAIGGDELPARILVLLDGYGAFASTFDRPGLAEHLDLLPRIVGEGRPLGLHLVITAERRGAVPSALSGVISERLVLRQSDEDEYSVLGIDQRAVRGIVLPPGRGFAGEGLEVQVAVCGGANGAEQAAEIERLGASWRSRWSGELGPRPIGVLPAEIPFETLPAPTAPLHAAIGIADDGLEPIAIRSEDGHFLVAGPHRSGRSTTLRTLVRSLQLVGSPPRFVLLAPRRSPLAELGGWSEVALGADACALTLRTLAERLARGPLDGPLVVVIDDGEELEDSPAGADLVMVARRGRDSGCWILGSAEIRSAHRAFGGWIAEVRKDEHGLLLDPEAEIDGDLLGARLPRRGPRAFPPGRGYLVRRGDPALVQAAQG